MSWSFLLCDKDSDTELGDLTEFALTTTVSPRLSRPRAVAVTLPGDTAVLSDTSFDGRPNLEVGRRTIKSYQDGVLRGNELVWTVAPSGDASTTSIVVSGYDPTMLLPKRLVQDSTGNFSDPSFPSPISGAEILQLAIANTIANDGPLPIDLTGPIASSVDLAADLTNWPITIGDLLTALTNTGQLDVFMNPVDTHLGYPAGTIASMTAADQLGSDLTGTVHLDYATGDCSIANIRRSFDLDELCNKLWYYLGVRKNATHYPANITGTETGPNPPTAPYAEDLTAYEALQLASRTLYGVFMDTKQFDIAATKDSPDWATALKLWHEEWKTEVQTRVNPRELLYVTPAAGTGSPYRPFVDYNPGDLITINAAGIVGPPITGAFQRIYGFDVTIGQDGVERVGELLVTADAA